MKELEKIMSFEVVQYAGNIFSLKLKDIYTNEFIKIQRELDKLNEVKRILNKDSYGWKLEEDIFIIKKILNDKNKIYTMPDNE